MPQRRSESWGDASGTGAYQGATQEGGNQPPSQTAEIRITSYNVCYTKLLRKRTVIQWDKDDLDELGLLKVDVLGLGMLSAIRRSLELIARNNFV